MSKTNPTPPASAPAVPALVKARVLTGCAYGAADDVVELAPDAVENGKNAGELDPDPAAVAYELSLKPPAADATLE